MKIITQIPKSNDLKNDISHLYFLNNAEKTSFSIYPSNHIVIMFYKNAEVVFSENKIRIIENEKIKFSKILAGPINQYREIEYCGNVSMFAIIFKHYSLYNFDNFTKYYLNEKVIIDSFFDSLNVDNIYYSTPQIALDYIEQYLLSVRTPLQIDLLDKCLDLITKNENISVNELSIQTKNSKKNVIDKFKKYIGRTPSQFMLVNKFRSSLKSKSSNLTNLAYKNGFYDQSHMIKKYRKLTSNTPGTIKAKENISNSEHVLWLD